MQMNSSELFFLLYNNRINDSFLFALFCLWLLKQNKMKVNKAQKKNGVEEKFRL